MDNLINIAKNAKTASYKLASLSTEIKNKALEQIANKLEENSSLIFSILYLSFVFF